MTVRPALPRAWRGAPAWIAAAVLIFATAAHGAEVRVGSASAPFGESAVVSVAAFDVAGVAALQNDIVFGPGARIGARVETVTVLAADIDELAVQVAVADASALPEFGTIVIDSERIVYAAKEGNLLTVAARGARGSAAAAHTAGALVAADRSIPDCAPTSELGALGKTAVFSFLPQGCDPAVDCTSVRAAVLSLDNLEALPDATSLYNCNVVAGQTPGSFTLGCAAARATDSIAGVLDTSCVDGSFDVGSACLGDQNGDGIVTVDEVTRAFAALTLRNVTFNPTADGDGNGAVSPAETIRSALNSDAGICEDVGASEQEISIGLGLGIGLPTQFVSIPVMYQGDSQSITAFSFDVPYDLSEPYQWVADEFGQVQCVTEPGFSDVILFGQVLPQRVAFTVIDNLPPNVLGAAGIVGHCNIRINEFTFANFSLPCASGSGAASDLNGAAVTSVTCEDGMVLVATPPASPTPTPTPFPASVRVAELVEGGPDETVDVEVRLTTNGNLVAGAQLDIEFPAAVPVESRGDSRPNCTVNPDINKNGTSFAYVPFLCSPGIDCLAVRALVLSLSNVDPIPDGLLFTCRFRIPSGAEIDTIYPLPVANLGASDPDGFSLPLVGAGGSIVVVEGTADTPTATPTPTPTATAQHTPTLTAAPTATPTALITPTVTPLGIGCAGDCDRNGGVEITDLITGVSIGQGRVALASCPSYDVAADGLVDIAELLLAVQNLRDGCP
jgi:hypothetical protein